MIRVQLSLALLILTTLCNGQVSESVLAKGIWYKLPIGKSGVYKIDAAYLSSQNITIEEGKKLHIYGQRGGMLPEKVVDMRTHDLVEFPLYEENVTQGSLEPDAAVYFYAEGADGLNINNQNTGYHKNIYDNFNYVFINISLSETKKIEYLPDFDNPEYISDTYEEIQRYEEDKANPLGLFPTTHGSGQEWYGDEFSNLRSKEYSSFFDFRDVDLNSSIRVKAEFVGRSSSVTTFELMIDNNKLSDNIGSVRTGDVEAIHARKAIIDEVVILNATNPKVSINYPRVTGDSKGWLDYIELKFRRKLILNERPIVVRDSESINYGVAAFTFSQPITNTTVAWDITNPEYPERTVISNDRWSYKTDDELKYFIVFDTEKIPTPETDVIPIGNQNLHGIVDADMVIVYHKAWKNAAKRLGDHRADYSELLVEIIDIDNIYNEFSSGRQDPTAIRDFAKMLNNRSENFRYLLLFGDGSYDFRGIDATSPYQSFVPTYETYESLDPLQAFPSDDYFAQLDENEGNRLRGDLDIAIGRLPARTNEEAENFVNKLIAYDLNKESFGNWRSRIAFLADDEDSNLHLNDADIIATKVSMAHPLFNQKKIYWDAFRQESTPGGNRYPGANEQLNTDIEDGLLVMNYLGHGGPKGWSQERVLNLDDITSWSNLERLPLVITATCSFTGFDDPNLTTAGEAVIHNPTGGAIALFTTVRSVYASQNFRLTSAVFDTIFTKVDGDYMTIGEVMQSAKNTRINDVVNARKFFLIGDPAMKLAIPRQQILTTVFNGKAVRNGIDTIGALQKVTVKAQIITLSGKKDISFNGEAVITLFDKASEVRTLRNDPGSFQKLFKVQKNVLYSGRVSVINGEMELNFIIPLDIDYELGKGRLSYYAVSDNGLDAAGYFNQFVIGGTSKNAVQDKEGPQIDIFLNTKNITKENEISSLNPKVIVDFFDISGINVSNVSIGHEIVSILDGDTRSTKVLNQKYISEIDDFQKGSLSFRLNDLTLGLHTLTIRAFDVLNNPGTKTMEFEVVENFDEFLTSVLAYPNPFQDEVMFSVENELGEAVNMELNVYNLQGQLIHSIIRNGITNSGLISRIKWNGESVYGPVSGGIYMYEVLLNSVTNEKFLKSGLKKIIVLK